MQITVCIIAILAGLWLVFLPEIISFLRISGRCAMFARQNIQTNKIKYIKNIRAFVLASAIIALSLVIQFEPSWQWCLVAGCLLLRAGLVLVAHPKHDRSIFHSAFAAYYTIFPLCVLAILPLTCLFKFFDIGIVVFPYVVIFVFIIYYFRILRIEFQLLKGDFSRKAIFGYMLLIELIPIVITSICYFLLK